MIDVELARKQTPGCANVVHFNNAGAALAPQIVINAVDDYIKLEYAQGGYEAEEIRADEIERFYTSGAKLLNCKPDEVAFIENATRAWDMAFYSLQFNPGDRILTANSEYASNYIAFLQVQKRTGATVHVVPSDETGQVSVSALADAIDSRTKLIAITHVPTNGGLVNPAAEIGKVAREAGVLYLLDACQSAGQMPLDVDELGCDIMSCTGRKFLRGPRGTGLLFIKETLLRQVEPIFLDLHAAQWIERNRYVVRDDARRFETWECNYSNKVGLTAAMDYAMSWGLDNIWIRVCHLADHLRARLDELIGVTVHDIGRTKCGIVTFSIAGVSPADIQRRLREQRINVSTTTDKGTRLDMETRGLKEMVRASVHYYNTEHEVDAMVRAVEALTA